jgi:dihydrofolate reductase
MRKVVTDHLISLDGYFASPDNGIDWFKFDDESLEWSRRVLRTAGTIVLGRQTYELFTQFWPTDAARKEEPYIAERLTNLPKLVFSRTLRSGSWANTDMIRRPIPEVVRELKQTDGGDVVLLGSSSILAPLWKEGLVDELNLRVQPVVLGKGRPLFPNEDPRQNLELQESQMFKSGVAALRYSVLPPPPAA